MKRHQTSDEVREEILTSFPGGTGELFHKLWISVSHLHLNWKNYRSLFGTSPERVELLNWAASSFFGLLDGILRHNVVLAIARLTDPPRSAGKDNASLAHLVDMLTPFIDAAFIDELRSELEGLQAYCEPIRQLRNRLLAHDDLATALKYHPDPLPGISRAYIEEALEKIRRLLGDIEEHFRGSRTSHQYIISSNDGESLISALESAREHERCRQREFNQEYGINRPVE
jgi:hypothetical protein